jgi:hypothetical protein
MQQKFIPLSTAACLLVICVTELFCNALLLYNKGLFCVKNDHPGAGLEGFSSSHTLVVADFVGRYE